MCAIFGTSNRDQIEQLYNINHNRGGFALGSVCITTNNQYAIKKMQTQQYVGSLSYTFFEKYTKYYLFHDQAPTSSVRTFSIETSHPFQYGEWIVAHNGVLTNHKELIDNHDCEVDSSYIPALLHKSTGTDVERISKVCTSLQGTFACWIINVKTMQIYLVKQGSTLFCKDNSFSSIKLNDWESLKDGIIYEVKDKIEEVGYFHSNNPFMVLI